MSSESDEVPSETVEDWDPLPLDPQPDVWEPVPLPENPPAENEEAIPGYHPSYDWVPTRVPRGVERETTREPVDAWEQIRIDWRKVKDKWLRKRR